MLSREEARTVVAELVRAATQDAPAAWATGVQLLELLDARSLHVLDESSRGAIFTPALVSGRRGWTATPVLQQSVYVASLHADGHVREDACRALGISASRAVPEPPKSVLAARFLALRLLDHVVQVRHRAWQELSGHLDLTSAVPVLDVLLTGASRQHAPDALRLVTTYLRRMVGVEELLAHVLRTGRPTTQRSVRRWAYRLGATEGVLSHDVLMDALDTETDQVVRDTCVEFLGRSADPSVLRRLLRGRSVQARLGAAMRTPPQDLADDDVEALLIDRSARVRGPSPPRQPERDAGGTDWRAICVPRRTTR